MVKFHEVEGKEGKRWTCQGSGNNQYGKFSLLGEYRFKGKGDDPKLHLEKTYLVEKKEKRKKSGKGYGTDEDVSDSEDEDFDDVGADQDELNALKDEAEMSVEELRKKAYGGGEDAKEEKNGESWEAGESPKKKKRRVVESEDEDGDF